MQVTMDEPITTRATAHAPALARARARVLLAEWGVPGDGDGIELVITELVTNAVRATRGMRGENPLVAHRLTRVAPTTVLIEVWDNAPGEPRLIPAVPADAESGRGLYLVDELSSHRWGWQRSEAWWKLVWAHVETTAIAAMPSMIA
jgi:anti-sigma regulatory factor (Ser/Thr protein kinase)